MRHWDCESVQSMLTTYKLRFFMICNIVDGKTTFTFRKTRPWCQFAEHAKISPDFWTRWWSRAILKFITDRVKTTSATVEQEYKVCIYAFPLISPSSKLRAFFWFDNDCVEISYPCCRFTRHTNRSSVGSISGWRSRIKSGLVHTCVVAKPMDSFVLSAFNFLRYIIVFFLLLWASVNLYYLLSAWAIKCC